jgi:hypothetical protein
VACVHLSQQKMGRNINEQNLIIRYFANTLSALTHIQANMFCLAVQMQITPLPGKNALTWPGTRRTSA